MVRKKNWVQELKKWRQQNADRYAQSLLQEPVKTTLYSEIPHPGVVLIMGDKREGKSALAHEVVAQLHRRKGLQAVLHLPEYVPYVMRERIQKLLPFEGNGRKKNRWFQVATKPSEWPSNAVVVYDEASQSAHARRTQSGKAIRLDNMIGISGQRNQTILFISHHSRKIDVNVVTEVSRIIYKTPTEAHAIFERDELSDFTYRALDYFCQLNTDRKRKTHSLSLSLKPRIQFSQFSNGLAPWWSEELSCLFHEIEMLG